MQADGKLETRLGRVRRARTRIAHDRDRNPD